ncbi:MAG: hypothetical protein AAGK47_08620 [Bacteroidota bacterium]
MDNFSIVILVSKQAKSVVDAAHRCGIFKTVHHQKNKLKHSSCFLLVAEQGKMLTQHKVRKAHQIGGKSVTLVVPKQIKKSLNGFRSVPVLLKNKLTL